MIRDRLAGYSIMLPNKSTFFSQSHLNKSSIFYHQLLQAYQFFFAQVV